MWVLLHEHVCDTIHNGFTLITLFLQVACRETKAASKHECEQFPVSKCSKDSCDSEVMSI